MTTPVDLNRRRHLKKLAKETIIAKNSGEPLEKVRCLKYNFQWIKVQSDNEDVTKMKCPYCKKTKSFTCPLPAGFIYQPCTEDGKIIK